MCDAVSACGGSYRSRALRDENGDDLRYDCWAEHKQRLKHILVMCTELPLGFPPLSLPPPPPSVLRTLVNENMGTSFLLAFFGGGIISGSAIVTYFLVFREMVAFLVFAVVNAK